MWQLLKHTQNTEITELHLGFIVKTVDLSEFKEGRKG